MHYLPGPLSITNMSNSGVLHAFDATSAYLGKPADTVHGRGVICRQSSPAKVIACASLAAWVWVGGEFPSTIDVVSDAHFRSPIFGRRVRPFSRKIDRRYITTVGGMPVTTPIRTACDIVLIQADTRKSTDHATAQRTIRLLMDQYGFGMSECLDMLNADSKHCPKIRDARTLLTRITDTTATIQDEPWHD
ncbi:hypothetical protein BTHE_1789 [Bifidobacterium thermophilum]|nr:hypothetical protein BTHE_1789 [Bifidobacterium thermophilum]